MSWWHRLTHRNRMEQQLEKEMRFHLDQHASDLIAQGRDPEEARREARLALGGPEQAKEQCRDARGTRWLEELWHDFRYALRTLRKQPAFTALAALTLALGIGAATAVFSLVNTVLLRALPYRDPQRLVYLWEPNPRYAGVPVEAFAPFNADFYDWQKQNHSFSNLALFTVDDMNLSIDGNAARVNGSRVTGEFFELLGIAPELGRAVGPDDDQPGKGQVAVISHSLWQSRFGSDRGTLGKQLLLNARPYRIVGVMPAGFAFPHETESLDTLGKRTDVWVPLAFTPQQRAARDDGPGNAIGRLRSGVSLGQAQAEMSAIVARIDPLHPAPFQGSHALVRPFDVSITGASRRALLIFMAAVLLVLLIASSNVASLVLARASGRTLEIGVRTALGASRLRLIRQLLVESLCLAGSGGLLGTLAAYLAIRFLIHANPGKIPRVEEISMDWRVLLFALGAALATAALFGLFPALSASRSNLNDALKGAGRRTAKGAAVRFRSVLMIAEVALTFVLLAGAGLLIRSFIKLQSVDKGFAAQSTVTMHIQLDARYNQRQRQTAFLRSLLERAGALPGVEAAAAIDHLPLGGGESLANGLQVEGRPSDSATLYEMRSITPRYFAAMGIRLLAGRVFTDDDTAVGQPVVIVSRNFVRQYFPGEDAVGKRLHVGDSPGSITIVGVVADVRYESLEAIPPMQVYTPLWQNGANAANIAIRTALPADRVAADMRALVRSLDPAVALADVRTMDQLVSAAAAERRFQTLLLTAFGGLALLLSLVGLYALMSFSVAQRTAEIGIRMALGAQRANVMRLILRQGSALALIGIALGCGCAWVTTRALASLLYEVQPADAPTFLCAAALFCVVALAACYAPARRAARVDPIVSLRYE